MKLRLLVLLLFLAAACSLSAAVDNCISCHNDFEDDDGPSHIISKDIHFQKGLGCVSCHGGDASFEDMDEVREHKSYRGVPSYKEVPNFCASCHSDAAYMHEHNPSLPTDQLDKYKTSVHGERLLTKGDTKVANCISCHSVHSIANSKLPYSTTHPLNLPQTCGHCHSDAEYMKEYNIPTTQLDDYKKSVHGIALLEREDLGAPACNDCHGNHGAAPPGVASLSAVCGTCHALEADLYNASPHADAFAENDFPMCETCHSNHFIEAPSDEQVGTSEAALCMNCHDAGDGTKGYATADSIKTALVELVAAHQSAKTVLDEAIFKGMMTTDQEFLFKEVNQLIIKARTNVHAFNFDSVKAKTEEGLTKAKEVEANSAALIDEYYFRRKGLGLASLFITLLVVALWLKIRKMEKGNS